MLMYSASCPAGSYFWQRHFQKEGHSLSLPLSLPLSASLSPSAFLYPPTPPHSTLPLFALFPPSLSLSLSLFPHCSLTPHLSLYFPSSLSHTSPSTSLPLSLTPLPLLPFLAHLSLYFPPSLSFPNYPSITLFSISFPSTNRLTYSLAHPISL